MKTERCKLRRATAEVGTELSTEEKQRGGARRAVFRPLLLRNCAWPLFQHEYDLARHTLEVGKVQDYVETRRPVRKAMHSSRRKVMNEGVSRKGTDEKC